MNSFIDAKAFEDHSIVAFLASLGHHPVKKSGKEYFYHSMIRETAKNTPSFTVWDAGGKWIDRGDASGKSKGGIVQLGMALWPNRSYYEVLQQLAEICGRTGSAEWVPGDFGSSITSARSKSAEGYNFILVSAFKPGTNKILSGYLESRAVLDAAMSTDSIMKEVYYRSKDYNGFKSLYALGWENENKGWEFIQTNGFKGTIGPKGVSVIEGHSGNQNAVVFEGYMDYLSWLKAHNSSLPAVNDHPPTVFVLNSISLLDRVLDRLKSFNQIEIYFDNDPPGIKACARVKSEILSARDCSYHYQGFKDYNEMLMAQSRQHPTELSSGSARIR